MFPAGASSGIGQGIAMEYAKYGPHLALTGRSMERLEETKKLCIESGLDASNVRTDSIIFDQFLPSTFASIYE